MVVRERDRSLVDTETSLDEEGKDDTDTGEVRTTSEGCNGFVRDHNVETAYRRSA